jgi:putative hydrolase of HD superfamily
MVNSTGISVEVPESGNFAETDDKISVMEWKSDLPLGLVESKELLPILLVYLEFTHLKNLYRQGWLQRGVPKERCESVAEHTFATAVLALLLAEAYFPQLDACQVARLGLIHDFGEVYTGDLTPQDRVKAREKHRLEREAVRKIFSRLPQGEQYARLWEDYEKGATPEARFVKQIDRLEMGLQAWVYERQGMGSMQDFFDSARQALSEPILLEALEAMEAQRSPFEKAAQGKPGGED